MSSLLLSLRDVVCPLGGGPVLKLPRLDVEPGQQWVLTGPSGCGKSSLLNLIAGILPADSGTVSVMGYDVQSLSGPERDRLRGREIGFIFQNFNLLEPFTVLENVELGLYFAGKPDRSGCAQELLVRVGLGHRLDAKPSSLSVGERQRVAVARALAPAPRLLLADEPTGSLDPATAEEVCSLIQSMCMARETALLFVTHDQRLQSRFQCRLDASALLQERASS